MWDNLKCNWRTLGLGVVFVVGNAYILCATENWFALGFHAATSLILGLWTFKKLKDS